MLMAMLARTAGERFYSREKLHMKSYACRLLLLLVLSGSGCQNKSAIGKSIPADADSEINANLALLGPEDHRLAEQQKYCFVMDSIRLGEMGRPFKVSVKGETAFVCCENCIQAVERDPAQALAQIKQLQRARANGLPAHNP